MEKKELYRILENKKPPKQFGDFIKVSRSEAKRHGLSKLTQRQLEIQHNISELNYNK